MLQLWKLVLLCGLLTGTSASGIKSVRDGLSNAVKKMEPVFGDIENSIQGESVTVTIGGTQELASQTIRCTARGCHQGLPCKGGWLAKAGSHCPAPSLAIFL